MTKQERLALIRDSWCQVAQAESAFELAEARLNALRKGVTREHFEVCFRAWDRARMAWGGARLRYSQVLAENATFPFGAGGGYCVKEDDAV